jgi:transcription termination/antitermination protein NusA
VQYVTKALSPAKISRVSILDPAEKQMEVVVDDPLLSLAIGKRGHNVRLAAKLIGWKIDIKSEEEKRREMEVKMADMVISGAPVSVLLDHGLDEQIMEKLVAAGIGTVERLGSMTPEELEAIPDIDETIVAQIQSAVVSFYGEYDSEESEIAPADAETVETVLDAEALEHPAPGAFAESEPPPAFENIETGVLEHDLARHEAALLEETGQGEVLDLGRVEGLSAAPSTLRDLTTSDDAVSSGASDTMKNGQ